MVCSLCLKLAERGRGKLPRDLPQEEQQAPIQALITYYHFSKVDEYAIQWVGIVPSTCRAQA
jgi:hypothetical protein